MNLLEFEQLMTGANMPRCLQRGALFDFDRSVFNKDATFDDAKFEDCVNFNNSKFKKRADFLGSQFSRHADFFHTHFDEELNLTRATFTHLAIRWDSIKEHLIYDNATYLFLSNTPQLCCGDEHITNKQLLCSHILGTMSSG